ncbi:hypothetical protein JTE90_027357 [Oedothorax gibbosus]|uniref:Uncharacterized protein n=1 Tax=Oedothorax gibbosus TaxID=931172 RepID=A0AAV6W190_9ARAC|nr:hypothetical protein JTE90_027357 [Oedothorax gibbosus]
MRKNLHWSQFHALFEHHQHPYFYAEEDRTGGGRIIKSRHRLCYPAADDKPDYPATHVATNVYLLVCNGRTKFAKLAVSSPESTRITALICPPPIETSPPICDQFHLRVNSLRPPPKQLREFKIRNLFIIPQYPGKATFLHTENPLQIGEESWPH